MYLGEFCLCLGSNSFPVVHSQSALIQELQDRVLQLSGEAEKLGQLRNQLEREKIEVEGRADKLQSELMTAQERLVLCGMSSGVHITTQQFIKTFHHTDKHSQ